VLIDWYTVAAQALNFLILVWLLKRFLYQPVLDAIGAREQRIAMQLADAASKEAAATKEREQFESKNRELDSQPPPRRRRSRVSGCSTWRTRMRMPCAPGFRNRWPMNDRC
jgi:F-type H+-transporting ATPase subunit b